MNEVRTKKKDEEKPELLHFLLKKQCNNLRVHRQLVRNEGILLLSLQRMYLLILQYVYILN